MATIMYVELTVGYARLRSILVNDMTQVMNEIPNSSIPAMTYPLVKSSIHDESFPIFSAKSGIVESPFLRRMRLAQLHRIDVPSET